MTRKRHHSHQQHPLPAAAPVKTTQPLPQEVKGLIVLAITLIFLVSTLSFAYASHSSNWLGALGHTIGKIIFAAFGLGSYFLFLLMAWVGWRILLNKPLHNLKKNILCSLLCIAAVNLIFCIVEDTLPDLRTWLGQTFIPQMWIKKLKFHLGGAPFYFIYHDIPKANLLGMLNTLGVTLLALSMLGLGLLYLCKSDLQRLMLKTAEYYTHCVAWVRVKLSTPPKEEPAQNISIEEIDPPPITLPAKLPSKRRPQRVLMALPPQNSEPFIEDQTHPPLEEEETSPEDRREKALRAQRAYNGDFQAYDLPSADLLTPAKPIDSAQLDEILRHQADILEETLLNFGIVAKVGNINCGPTITSFEVHPSVGVKVQRIKALEDDIALNLEARSIRIIAPIPGKAAVGVEVPSPFPQEVGFQDILLAYQRGNKRFHIPILLGKAVNGEYVMSDLAKMPHLIIAGATGSGKSVCINTIVMSIVLNARPDEVRLVMVDPKKVELTPYSPLPHMLAPVITEPSGACAALQWLVKEMESRYELLKLLGYRNIDSFNTRTPDAEKEASLNRDVPEKLFYIVGIIDELADLMMVSSHDIETYIARIAQMARAVGIHLILATQRPSREVITGLIKANFPARISFKVASRVNSQIILDETGAETLLGNGDMLFLPPGTSTLMRAQGAYIRDEDINRVIQKICEQSPPRYIINSFDDMHISGFGNELESEDGPLDPLYEQAKEVILSTGNASTTFLQRKLKMGYARAAGVMDQLERQGIIGPAEGSKPRKILGKVHRQPEDDEDFDNEL